ncbi:hypothetical protein LJY25_13805 [Hymenobacter sp. BT175]|uniref:hypothetical protein n=1 Tax=Hymenobacter translucens TaxID=2886507 RepID=UPI001D0DFCC7|nr:hypothetical protein [Hymenobacter translucens]MCC2547526.1 hypothetical protein [Hymenobacter translucens]
MNDKYSQTKREQYGLRLAAQLCNQHFDAQPDATLDGPAVLRFTPVRQVNLFVVQQLLQQWTAEMGKLRSPYFNFEAPDVRQALTQFMNILSRRIKLARPAYEPLLARAITDTLTMAIDPVATFEHKLLGSQPTATAEQLREGLRYLDLDKDLYKGFVDTLTPGSALERDFLLNRFRLHQEANYKSHQPLEKLVAELSALLPLTEADLREDGPVSAAKAPEAPKTAEVPRFVSPAPAPEPAPAPPKAEPAPAALSESTAPAPVAASSAPAAPATVVPAPAAPAAIPAAAAPVEAPKPAAEPSRPLTEAAPAGVPLYEKLKAENPGSVPLGATLRTERPAATLADKAAPRVESLREAISINQRFSFINELFNGENMEYHTAIQHLDSLPTATAAKRYVSEDLTTKYGWVRKEEHVNKLLKLIDRKFA